MLPDEIPSEAASTAVCTVIPVLEPEVGGPRARPYRVTMKTLLEGTMRSTCMTNDVDDCVAL